MVGHAAVCAAVGRMVWGELLLLGKRYILSKVGGVGRLTGHVWGRHSPHVSLVEGPHPREGLVLGLWNPGGVGEPKGGRCGARQTRRSGLNWGLGRHQIRLTGGDGDESLGTSAPHGAPAGRVVLLALSEVDLEDVGQHEPLPAVVAHVGPFAVVRAAVHAHIPGR